LAGSAHPAIDGGAVRSWEPSAASIAGHEPARAADGRFHTYWMARPENLPADLGLEWPESQQISSVIVRYFDGRMARGPAIARTQEWARLQSWQRGEWQDVEAEVIGQETSSVRYVFPPLTSTRIRLLFTEPPDPEARRFPDRLGIYVCELEAYRDVPFQWVSAPGHVVRGLQRGRTYLKHFNEPPSGDSSFDIPGPLIIEPKRTRTFSETLNPTLIVAESRWANENAEAERRPETAVLRNGFLELELSLAGVAKEVRLLNRVSGESQLTPRSRLFAIRTAQGELTPAGFQAVGADTEGSTAQAARLRINLTSAALDVAIHYELRKQDHFYHKWLTLTNKSAAPVEVRDVIVSALGLPDTLDLMAGQELTYPVCRLKDGGFFSALETVYWDHRGDALAFYPGVTLKPGLAWDSEKAVVGVYRNRGEMVAGWDWGVREWVIEYHAQVSPVPEPWPDIYCEAWSARMGVRDILERPQWSERFFDTARQLGIRYMDVFEATHEALVMPVDWLKRLTTLGERYGIATGFWTDFGSAADFAGLNANLNAHACKLSPEADEYFNKMVELTRTHKFRAMHWGDFLSVWPCPRTEHGHLPGKHSIYAQGQRVLRFHRQLREASPGIMLGADGGFTNPQYVRHEDSRAHGIFYGGFAGDHFPAVEPDIHLDRLYAGMNRTWVYGGYAVFLRPWFRMINGVNHFGQETQNHDRAGFRYSLLSAIAMAAQLTYNDVPVDIPESEIRFARRWTEWARANRDYLKQGDKLFDRTLRFADVWQGDPDALSGFSHIRGDRGYVFLMNPAPVDHVAELTLALDGPRFGVEEVYPGGLRLGTYPRGDTLRVSVPAKQVRIISVSPPEGVQQAGAPRAETSRYIGEWTIAERGAGLARLQSRFTFPASGRRYLDSAAPPSAWTAEPWAHDKAYLVLLLKDELEELGNNWVPDDLRLRASVNGVPKTVHAFKTRRTQSAGLARCYFIELRGEVRPEETNAIEVTLPIRQGLVFSGAYIDLPDQMPDGLPRNAP
jgi:hypothetical protein